MALFFSLKKWLDKIPLLFNGMAPSPKQIEKLKGRPIITIMRPKASLTYCYL